MGMSEFYGKTDEEESLKTIDFALEQGINFFDTADMYGIGQNEILLGIELVIVVLTHHRKSNERKKREIYRCH